MLGQISQSPMVPFVNNVTVQSLNTSFCHNTEYTLIRHWQDVLKGFTVLKVLCCSCFCVCLGHGEKSRSEVGAPLILLSEG
ncbi:hypothetical protein AAFF_G00346160 [Aldrovandia affinis]|uniref:Uncharacterized protein n=1 Tax=Aldrovandia affinis TaxID=143900 RepID=A0AAD7SJN1_9TELE|nr:hypothetical protein AAFF_G00346160 [Aldrovandia affinis]